MKRPSAEAARKLKSWPTTQIFDELPRRYFEESKSAAEIALKSTLALTRVSIQMGGQVIGLRLAGRELAGRLLPALEHLRTDAAAEWDIVCWDESCHPGGMRGPTPAMRAGCYQKAMLGICDRRFRFFYTEDSGSVGGLDLREKTGFHCVADASALPPHESGAPLRTLWNAILNQSGVQMLHGGAVSKAGEGVVIVGAPGAGKSTTAMACLQAGWDYLGDDLVAVSLNDPPRIYSCYSTWKMRESASGFFPGMVRRSEMLTEYGENKRAGYLSDLFPESLCAEARLRAIVVPVRKESGLPRLEKIHPIEVLKAIMEHTMNQVAATDDALVRIVMKTLSKVPLRGLVLGEDPSRTPGVLEGLIP